MQLDLYSTEMVQKLIRKDERTFNGLYDQYAAVLYGIVCRQVADRLLADELLRQTFVSAWRDIEHYDSKQDGILNWLIRKCCSVIKQHTGTFNYSIEKASLPGVSGPVPLKLQQ